MPGEWILIGAMTTTLVCAMLLIAILAEEALEAWRRRRRPVAPRGGAR